MTPRFPVDLWKALAGSHSRVTHPAYPLPPQHRGFPAPLQTEPGTAVSQVLGRKGLLLAHLPPTCGVLRKKSWHSCPNGITDLALGRSPCKPMRGGRRSLFVRTCRWQAWTSS